ncbi:putative N-acetylated-alpha-linked acidic dipeptidase isoform X1 [Lates japonicus]|uniref:N-acetylated-alpha-linked acidic dipeptidase isoform X1 n=1 Tax=Lates japonicus TaxID=270547 RepID=A0AAD3MN26_LATJO|nr:putative N-acetylated-alpha-linked acidic dipeptidase isoform X1 [Lates japonicus]
MRKESRLIRLIWRIVVVVALFFLGFIIGWFAKPTHPNTANNIVSSKYLREFLDEMQPDQIREHLRKFTRLPHLAELDMNYGGWEDFFQLERVSVILTLMAESAGGESRGNVLSLKAGRRPLTPRIPLGHLMAGICPVEELREMYSNLGGQETHCTQDTR